MTTLQVRGRTHTGRAGQAGPWPVRGPVPVGPRVLGAHIHQAMLRRDVSGRAGRTDTSVMNGATAPGPDSVGRHHGAHLPRRADGYGHLTREEEGTHGLAPHGESRRADRSDD